jgi:hypothetical protein
MIPRLQKTSSRSPLQSNQGENRASILHFNANTTKNSLLDLSHNGKLVKLFKKAKAIANEQAEILNLALIVRKIAAGLS